MRLILVLGFFFSLGCAGVTSKPHAPAKPKVAISTQGIESSRAAQEILDSGGNLFDAAIAASFVISVERPHSTGIGGGGFWISRDSRTGRVVALDFRERAPKQLGPIQKTLRKDPKHLASLLQDSPLGMAVPGFVSGMAEIHRRFGKLPWSQILQPAIRTASQGFRIYPDLADALTDRRNVLNRNPDAARIFLHPDGTPRKLGELLVQQDLANTLKTIASEGAESFYTGTLSKRLAAWLRSQGSRVSAEDLRNYRVIEREPILVQAFDRKLALMPPPSSGGIVLSQILKLLEPEASQLRAWGPADPRTLHRLAQAMQLAYADRARYLGDPQFTPIPVKTLLSDDYLQARRKMSFGEQAIAAEKIAPIEKNLWGRLLERFQESSDTTHLSLIDSEGNAIATTQSINGWMGSGQVISGTGIVLNNTMDDFSVAEGVRNLYGAIGSKPNRIAPGKTPLSSMTPTLVLDPAAQNQPLMAIGAPGGTRIITCVLQVLLYRWIHRIPLSESLALPRIHQQWIPDELVLEDPAPSSRFSDGVLDSLKAKGHLVKRDEVHCRVLVVEKDDHGLRSAVDPRDIGLAIVR